MCVCLCVRWFVLGILLIDFLFFVCVFVSLCIVIPNTLCLFFAWMPAAAHETDCVIVCIRSGVASNVAVLLFAPSKLNENGVRTVVVVLKYCLKLPKSYGFFVVDAIRFR